jgi:DNA-directed RNA polymerase specialized sigma24 family protein
VFDAAPRLLRLAIHLAGDPSEAEDLVQATFLTAIERAELRRVAPARAVARDPREHAGAGRKERREPDFDRLIAREQATRSRKRSARRSSRARARSTSCRSPTGRR